MPSKLNPQSFTYYTNLDTKTVGTVDLTKFEKFKSREGYGVWFYRGWFWKIFPKSKNYDRMVADYDKARAITPSYQFHVGTVVGNNGLSREGVALVSQKATGRSFKLKDSTGGFKKSIDSINNVAILGRIEASLIEAERIKLQDPQGFINANDENYPLLFIDIHTHTTPSANLIAMRKYVSKRIKDMQ